MKPDSDITGNYFFFVCIFWAAAMVELLETHADDL